MHKMIKAAAIILLSVSLQTTTKAQISYQGKWVGSLNNVNSFRMVFNFTEENKVITGTLTVPSQGNKAMPCKTITATDEDSFFISMPDINARYSGKLVDVNKIDGVWWQNGLNLVLNLSRTEGKVELNRPQTPKPPYSYNSEDVIFYTESKSMYYGATITSPKDEGRHPAIILISGSGPQNRDEELFDHKPFAVVADYLTKKGYVVLRVDDRGVGKTGGDRVNTTSADYANDVREAITYLQTRKEVDKKKIGLYGHSEGGMIAQMVAADNKDVNFIILMAAPGVKVTEVMTEQNVAILKTAGLNSRVVNSYAALYNRIVTDVTQSGKREEVVQKLYSALDNWKDTTDANTVLMTTGVKDSASRVLFVETFTEALWNKWMLYFLQYDPEPVLKKISCKVLAVNGDKDIQVIANTNLKGIERYLAQSKSKHYETRVASGVNHLFQECITCNAQEYQELEQTIKPEVLQIVGDWLDKHVK